MNLHDDRSLTRRALLASGLLVFTLLGADIGSLAQNAPRLQPGPINPAFLNMQADAANPFSGFMPNYGVRPGPLALPPMRSTEVVLDRAVSSTLPPAYDLRQYGKLSPVENQGQCGCCWAFATMGSLESCLLPEQLCSFSENNLKDTNGFDFGWNNGGNRDMATAYFARWSGPVNSADDPYNPNSGVSPANLAPSKHVQEVLYLPDRTAATDNNVIKQAVMNYGAVMTYFYMDPSLLSDSSGATTYYSPNGSASINHAVDIVGWDDNFDKSRFKTSAPGNGAFICRNSWGTSFGDGGYFYVSYYDAWTGKGGGNTVFNNAEPTNNYSQVYQYDPLGCVASIGLSGKQDLWFSNVFMARSADNVAAVSFYTLAPNTTYNVYVYNNASNGPITAASAYTADTGTFSTPGYHTVVLTTPIALTINQKFAVVVEVSANATSLIPIQCPVPGYSSKAIASAGQSYVSINGSNWHDLTTLQANTGVCLKAFIEPGMGAPSATNISVAPASGSYGQTVTLQATLQSVAPSGLLSGKTLTFQLNGASVGTGVTNSHGIAACSITIANSFTPGSNPIAVTYAGGNGYKASSGNNVLTVLKAAVKLTAANATAKPGSKVNLTAVLCRAIDNTPLAGRALSFIVNGAAAVTATTNSTGVATLSYTLPTKVVAGNIGYSLSFAGDATTAGGNATGTIVVNSK